MAVYPSKISVFLLGFAIGVIIAFINIVTETKLQPPKPSRLIGDINNVDAKMNKSLYENWLTKKTYKRYPVNFDYFSYSANKTLGSLLESNLLKSEVNVLCVMFIQNEINAYSASSTWMKHCNSVKLYSTKSVKYLDITIFHPQNSWHYLCEVLRHIDNNADDYMWVLFVPDDIFAILENLRHYVFGKNFEEPHYFGHSAVFWNEHFNLAQAGYVLSKGSVKALTKRFSTDQSCKASGKYWKNEDFYLGKYLSELGVIPVDTRDDHNRGRFHLFTPSQLMAPGNDEVLSKYWKTSLYPEKQGSNCCSPYSITFRAASGDSIYFFHYLLYKVNRHFEAGSLGNVKSNVYTPDQIWEEFVLDELGPNANLSAITPKKFYNLWRDKIDSPSIFNKRLRALFLGETDD